MANLTLGFALAKLDADGNVAHTTDFRRVYASLIEGWFGFQDSKALLSGDFSPLALSGWISGRQNQPINSWRCALLVCKAGENRLRHPSGVLVSGRYMLYYI